MPTNVPTMPWPRLKWPVPRVKSAIISGTITPNIAAVTPSSNCTATSRHGFVTERKQQAAQRQRGEADQQQRPAAPYAAPACRPTARARATTSCGTTMQAAINSVAQRLDRMVSTLPISGSIAALARWNSKQAAGEDQQRPVLHERTDRRRVRRPRALSARGVGARRRAPAPGSISCRRNRRSASRAGTEQQRR